MKMNVWQIVDLEKKYMDIISEIILSDDFFNDLKNIENYINSSYKYIDKGYAVDNKLAIALERLLTYHLFSKNTKINIKRINELPISSDVSFYTNDALLNIEAKTIDMVNNKNDDEYIELGPNQSTIKNKLYIPSGSTVPKNFNGYMFYTRLNDYERGLPNLTYSVSLVYYDNDIELKLSHINIYSIPHKIVAEKIYSNDLYINAKAYHYLSDKFVKKNKMSNKYISTKNPPHRPRIQKILVGKTTVYFDPDEIHPFGKFFPEMRNLDVTWAKENNRWKIRLYAKSSRIDKNRIQQRLQKNKVEWSGWNQEMISKLSHKKLEEKYNKFRNKPLKNYSEISQPHYKLN